MVQILRRGSSGQEVKKWQTFLRGFSVDSNIIVNGKFDLLTEVETKAFQSKKGLDPDGIVGPKTIASALESGYPLMNDSTLDVSGPNWPVKPDVSPLSPIEREKQFGKFSYVASPVQGNPEAITIKGDWVSKNITTVNIPYLTDVTGFSKSGNVSIHSALSKQFLDLFNAWNDARLSYLIMSWGGTWAPRFIRGSRTVLSNHAWATAFDINVQWNMLGAQPALKGQTGSVRELVNIAYEHGFYWGGWFPKRPDGMHFEAYKIL